MEHCRPEREQCLDNETGEIRQSVVCLRSKRSTTDHETGEPEMENTTRRRKRFHVPISYVKGYSEARKRRRKGFASDSNGEILIRSGFKVDRIEECVILGTQNVSPIVFMLPTLLMFSAWASIFCILCEACIHVLSHKRNKMRKYETQYKSPLHLISSEFCGSCRSHRWKEKIKQIQDKRSMRRKFSNANQMPEATL